jgi:hypothetical protein
MTQEVLCRCLPHFREGSPLVQSLIGPTCSLPQPSLTGFTLNSAVTFVFLFLSLKESCFLSVCKANAPLKLNIYNSFKK